MTKLGKDLLEFIEQVDDLIIDERVKDNIQFHIKGLDTDGSSLGYYDDSDNEIRLDLDKELELRYSLTLKEKPKFLSLNASYKNCIICRSIKDFKKYYYIVKQTMILFDEFAKKLENARKLNDMNQDFENED